MPRCNGGLIPRFVAGWLDRWHAVVPAAPAHCVERGVLPSRAQDFLASGHLPTLLSALVYFDLCFAVWVLNGAMAPYIARDLGLGDVEKGWMLSVPVIAGAFMRFPLGVLAQYIGRKSAAQVEMGTIVAGLLGGCLLVEGYAGVIAMGIVLGVAGASFGVALSLGSGHYPPRHKGLAMGIAGAGNSGSVLAVLFAPPLASLFGWKAVYGLAALPMIGAMVLLHLLAQEPPDREEKRLKDYLKIVVEADAWVFCLLYVVTFGGFIGLTSFLPTLFHDAYGVPREAVGRYAAGIILVASVLRIAGGALADRFGGVRTLEAVLGAVAAAAVAAAAAPGALSMVSILVVAFAALGAGNGAVFQLVPLRFRGRTAVAGSLIGEVGALGGGLLPVGMGYARAATGSFALGFLGLAAVAAAVWAVLAWSRRSWTGRWIERGGLAIERVEMIPAEVVT